MGSAAADELMLLERVFLTIGSADTDEQLENSVTKFLPPVLLKLSSPHEEVRKKVMELLAHINKRIRTRPLIQLPVEELLNQYANSAANAFISNFTIIYIKLGFPRMPAAKQAQLMPKLLQVAESKPQAHRDSLLALAIRALSYVSVPQDPVERVRLFDWVSKPYAKAIFLEMSLDLLLMPYGWGDCPPAPPAMSVYSYKRIVSELGSLDAQTLENLKLKIIVFLSSDVMPDSDTVCHLVVGSADTRFAVANASDLHLRKIIGSLEFDSATMMAPLFKVYLGSKDSGDRQIEPASTRLRLKLLPYLTRARGKAFIFPSCIRVLFESLYSEGQTNARLKSLALTFFTAMLQQTDAKMLASLSSVLLNVGLLKLVADPQSDPQLKQQAYAVMGQLVTKLPSLVHSDLGLLQKLFEALHQERDNEVKQSVRESLLAMLPAHQAVSADTQTLLLAVLGSQMESPSVANRLVAVQYVAAIFDAKHMASRHLLLLATGDVQEEVVLESLKGLYGADYRSAGTNKGAIVTPDLEVAIITITEALERKNKALTLDMVKKDKLPINVAAYTQVLKYLSLCLWNSAGANATLDRAQHPCEASPLIGRYLRSLHQLKPQVLDKYLTMIYQLLLADQNAVAIASLLECVGTIPDLLTPSFANKLDLIKTFLRDPREEMRELGAQLFGSICAFSVDKRDKEIINLCKILEDGGKDLELLHGTLLALGHTVERIINKDKQWCQHEQPLNVTVTYAKHAHMLVVKGACTAIGQMARCAALPVSGDTKLLIADSLVDIVSNPQMSTKVKESACKATGMLCVGEVFPHRQHIIDRLISFATETKEVEIHLALGGTLSCCVLGPLSPMAADPWQETKHGSNCIEAGAMQDATNAILAQLVDRLITQVLPRPHPSAKQACCIWLVSLLKDCGDRDPVIIRLMDLQATFMELLSENNDTVQEMASQGLSLVYNSGNELVKTQLVNQLVEQLTVGRRAVAQVSQDTKLFEEGMLGKSPSGGNLSTYKELCSLASDLNQPDLIYKFMNLANHNSVWNSKKGAGFGFSTIAAQAGEQLAPHLPKIIPRLYRYQFDPTPKIQQSMASIWHALVPETNKTIDEYHKEILDDLITNLTASQWRVRISCCSALSDFIRSGGSKMFEDCLDRIPELWSQLFRVMDDVHEGTRNAALGTSKILSKLCIRHCDADNGKAGDAMLKTILPIFLEQGITHIVKEVRAISIETVSKLVSLAGKLITPYLCQLIPALLQAAGETESPLLNRISTTYSADQDTQELIDSFRVSQAKSHFMTETIYKCVPFMTGATLGEMLPRLTELLRSSVSLATRISAAHFVVLLADQLTIEEMQPHTGKLLGALVSGLSDRNTAVRRCFAVSIGQLVRTAKDSSVDRLLQKLNVLYMEKDDVSRSSVGLVLQAMARYNSELIKSRADLTLPLVFYAMHSPVVKSEPSTQATRDLWEEVWHELAPGTEAALLKHGDIICNMLQGALESPSWPIKAQAARSIQTVANKLGENLQEESRERLIGILLCGLPGRTWDGKESILQALASVVKNSPSLKGSETSIVIAESVLKECKKEKVSYRIEAVESAGEILEILELHEFFKEIFDIIVEIVKTKEGNSAKRGNQDEIEENTKKSEELISLRETALRTLGKVWPKDHTKQAVFYEQVINLLVGQFENSIRSVQVVILAALVMIIEKLTVLTPAFYEPNNAILHFMLPQCEHVLTYSFGITKHTRLRKEALNVLFLLAKKLKAVNATQELARVKDVFNTNLSELSKDNSPEIKSRVVDMKDFFTSMDNVEKMLVGE